jgi:hypothetical protein
MPLLQAVRERRFMAGPGKLEMGISLDVSRLVMDDGCLTAVDEPSSAAAFLEFHEPLAAFLFPQLQRNEDDTLLKSEEVYHNFVKVDVVVRHVVSPL